MDQDAFDVHSILFFLHNSPVFKLKWKIGKNKKNKMEQQQDSKRRNKTTRQHFELLLSKIQTLFSGYQKTRNVVFTPSDERMLYVLYMCSVHESMLYHNHKCHLCIIYDKEKIVAMDINTRYSNEDMSKTYMRHAEMNAIMTLIKTQPTNQCYGIFITRFTKTSKLNHSTPCFFCARFIKKHLHYFHSVCFTNENEQLVVLTPDEFHNTEFCHQTQRFKKLISQQQKKIK